MKNLLKVITFTLLSLLILLNIDIVAWAASASMSGTEVVRAGDSITVYLYVNDSGKYGLEGTLSYDSSQVTLSSVNCNVSGWKLEQNGSSLVVYDDALSNPISGNTKVLTFKFKVNSNIATGSSISIAVKNLLVSDTSNASNIGTVTYKVTVARPLSGNANLSSLSVGGYTLSPAFASGTTSYDIGEVPFSVSSLNISYSAEDSNASVKVSGNALVVGANTVSVKVTAENGATKTYTIKVKRQQDPNYVASNNASLISIAPSSGQLSPTFNSLITDYVVYLPYEHNGKAFSASGTALDTKALGVTKGEVANLAVGENVLNVVCTAEDGTEKAYKITVVVMPEYTGELPEISGGDYKTEIETELETEKESEEETQVAEEETTLEEMSTKEEKVTNTEKNGINIGNIVTIVIAVIVALAVGAGIGFLVGYLICKKKNI